MRLIFIACILIILGQSLSAKEVSKKKGDAFAKLIKKIKKGEIQLHKGGFSIKGVIQAASMMEIIVYSTSGPYERSLESFIITDVLPSEIEALLIRSGFKKNDTVFIDIAYKKGNKEYRFCIEDLIIDPRTKKIMVRKGFVFKGSNISKHGNLSDMSGNICLIDPAMSPEVSDSVLLVKDPANQEYSASKKAISLNYKDVRIIFYKTKKR